MTKAITFVGSTAAALTALTMVSGCLTADSQVDDPTVSENTSEAGWDLSTTAAPSGTVNVRDFGAAGDGVTDDRAAIQAALNSGAAEVVVANGTYLVGRGAGFWNLNVPAGVTLRGDSRDGAIIQQAPGMLASVRLLQIAAPGVTVHDLTLDGNRARQLPDEHRSGVFASGAPGLTLRNVTAHNFTGDGFYLYLGTNNATVDSVLAIDNDRNGITFGGATTGGTVTNSSFVRNAAQQFDSEPGAGSTVDGLTLTNNTFDGMGRSNDFVLTVCGSTGTARSQGWTISGNTLNGGTYLVWADNIALTGNHGIDPTSKPAVTVYRTANNISIANNQWTMPQGIATALTGISIVGTGTGSAPTGIVIDSNQLSITSPVPAWGISATGANSVTITNNQLRGPGAAALGYAGVYLRATNINDDFKSAVVQHNQISSWGAYGVSIAGNGPARLTALDISSNTFDDSSGAMLRAVSLDDGTGTAQAISLVGNTTTGDVATLVARYPLVTPVLIGGQRGQGASYSVAITPEGLVSEVPGATALGRNGSTWSKTAGSDSLGWTATVTTVVTIATPSP